MFGRVALSIQAFVATAMILGGGQAVSQVSVPVSSTSATSASTHIANSVTSTAVTIAAAAYISASLPAQPASPAPLPVEMTTEQGLALARAKACLGCHQIDNKRVGPSFTVIAARRAQQEDAVSYLTHVIRKGGRGQYGAVPMPGQAVSEQDAQKLAQWILTLRK